MADSKVADLTAITSPASSDLLYLVHDPSGTPVDRKVTLANVIALGLAQYSILPSSDTYIDSQNATTNNDAATTLNIGSTWASTSYCRRILMTFDVSSLVGKTIAQAWIRLVATSAAWTGGGSNVFVEAVEMLRAYNATQVTWNVYSTGNNWATAGAKGSGTDRGAEYYGNAPVPANGVIQEVKVDVTRLLQKRLDAGDTTAFRALLGANATASDNAIAFHSLENTTDATYKPRLLVIAG